MGFCQKFMYSGAFYAYKKRGQLEPFNSCRTVQFHWATGPMVDLGGS